LDAVQRKILVFNLKGEHLYDLKMPGDFRMFVKFSNDSYACFADNQPMEDGTLHNFFYVKKGRIVNSYMEIPPWLLGQSVSGYPFSFQPAADGSRLFHTWFNDTLYSFNANPFNLKPAFILDFGKHGVDEDYIRRYSTAGSTFEKLMLLNTGGKIFNLRAVGYCNNKLLIRFVNKADRMRSYFAFYNPANKNTSLYVSEIGDFVINDFDLGLFNPQLLWLTKTEMVYTLLPHLLKTHLENLKSNFPPTINDEQKARFNSLLKMADTIEDEDNYVLVFARLKK